ncbi:two-component regulator propeller domain-containing protein [Spirosoma sp. KUDC1026]|uniref:ligand-binding sensor domain-containing protein n=1 Tax=Spirosoma sp. KUDC1026 TaxID=2745947 RepID=UPI001E4355B1|nr:sensor histidine kinase [Spirosoma sp. KUDC1026]
MLLLQLAGWSQVAYQVDHIGVSDGLAQGSVYYMHNDSRGFLWFGTQDGLNRYDGHRFRTYRPIADEQGVAQAGSIRGVNILGIVEDPAGNLWIGTEEGLNRYNRQRDQFDHFPSTAAEHSTPSARVLPFYIDKTTLLYLSDAEGLVQLNHRTLQKTVLNRDIHLTKEYDLPNGTVRTGQDNIWLHAPRGIIRYNLRDKSLTHYFSDHPANRFGPVQTVFSFHIDANEVAWLGTGNGLIRFDYRQQTYRHYPTTLDQQPISAIYSVAADAKGQLWLGTQRDGVLLFDQHKGQIAPIRSTSGLIQRLNEFEISKVYVDKMGVVWINTDPDGLVRIIPDIFLLGGLKKSSANSLPPDQRLSHYTVRGFMEERPDRLWIVQESGIDIFNPQTNQVVERYLTNAQPTDSPMHNQAKCIYKDPEHRIWVGTPGGVLAFQPATKTFQPILFAEQRSEVADNYVRNLLSLNDSTLLGATEEGLFLLNTRRRQWSRAPVLAGQNMFSLWYDAPTRQLWVGTYTNGYYCYQLPQRNLQGPWKRVSSGLLGYTVLHIRPDADKKTLWLSSDRGLVALHKGTNEFRLFSERQGLANSFVYGSLADAQGHIWISTNRGISRITLEPRAIKNFALRDGLQGYEFNGNAFCQTANGEFYFGGVNGFNRFRPTNFHTSLFDPKVHINSLSVNEEPFSGNGYVGEADRVELSPEQNTIALDFATIDFFSNGHNNYQYQLKNYDDRWVSSGERTYVRYANLPAGDYIFQVKAANKDGRWSNYTRRLIIHIAHPLWQRPPFLLAALLMLTLLIFFWIKRRDTMLRRQDAERLRLAYDIQEQVKKEIARDLHDEIGTRLATIKLYTTQLTRQVGETPTIISLRTTIFGLINETISDVRDLLRKLNPQTLERHGYVAAVDELFSRINATGIIDMQLDITGLVESAPDPDPLNYRFKATTEVMLYRITQELVNNSLKHANASRITLRLQVQNDRLLLAYTDNGQGFDHDKIRQNSTGLGLGSIESRAAILNGRTIWQTSPGHGMHVLIDVPTEKLSNRRFTNSRKPASDDLNQTREQ